MADISTYLDRILAAIYGRQVRGSIHDAIDEINKVSEKIFSVGATNPSGTPIYSDILYLNTTNYDLFKSSSTKPYTWNKIGNIEGNAITAITGPTADPNDPLKDIYTIKFSKLGDVTFNVENGKGITSITGPTADPNDPLKDTYTINYNDDTTSTFDIYNGKGIVSIVKTATSGLIDTYTITYNDDTTQNFNVINGKDGNTVHRGNEVTGQSPLQTGFTLTEDSQTGDTYLNNSGDVYTCAQGAEAGTQSLWVWNFTMAGGGSGGAQFLYELSDVGNSAKRGTVSNGQILMFDSETGNWEAKYGGSGHDLKPAPVSSLTEDDVVNYIRSQGTNKLNNEVTSIFGINKWTNVKTFRVVTKTGIGHYGIGEWKDSVVNPTAAQEQTWGWWQNDIFKLLGDTTQQGYDVDFDIKFDPGNGETITLGGYIIDTDTGYVCIKFANYLVDTSHAKVAIDVTFTRTDVNYPL